MDKAVDLKGGRLVPTGPQQVTHGSFTDPSFPGVTVAPCDASAHGLTLEAGTHEGLQAPERVLGPGLDEALQRRAQRLRSRQKPWPLFLGLLASASEVTAADPGARHDPYFQKDRLRRQDVGLQTHLDQLDRQISALQLDVRRGPGEAADSDSRPSSGFYELSDGGSCSLSTSCTSVCSDHVSCSLGTLLPAAPKARPGSGDCRPRSADETAVCGVPLPAWGPLASEEGPGQLLQEEPRPRPVSTGDLERILPADVGPQKAGAHPMAAPFLCHGVDPKYQCDLVSRGGREVYPYPSPLHAVALQSPLFALARETPQSEGCAPPRPPPASPAGPSPVRSGLAFEAGPPAAYIERLLQLRARGGARGAPRGEASPAPPQLGARKVDGEGGLEKPACTPRRAVVARARSASDGSERSAECASLLLSTAAESSGDEASDHTASRFGDAESSGSDSGGGGRLGQRARASSRLALPPVPRLCRVKASKALKRKIRRFQPAALKVMTMV
ncbi:hypothetical protein JEQ12_019026 [Ovis aries]|uniref:Dapper homolog 2 n=1 Tax=Ovis aries TaxID=9940 RepID=A0A836AAZ6_SHEEP|nr:hypothetical protein JEQ12_019026 [Ovis aries]